MKVIIVVLSLVPLMVFAETPDPAHQTRMATTRVVKREIPGQWANPNWVERAPSLTDTKEASSDADFRQLLSTIQYGPYQNWFNQRLRAMGSKLSLNQILDRWSKTNPQMTVTQLALGLAALENLGTSALGAMNAKLCSVITPYTQAMANQDRKSNHSGKESRWNVTRGYQEIEADTYPFYQKSGNLLDAARRCFLSPSVKRMANNGIMTTYEAAGWKYSQGHWQWVTSRAKSFCYDMRKSLRGAYYCAAAFSNTD